MKQRDWTIMIYMAGDNNLAVDMAYTLDQIKNVAGEGANLFVYYDGNSPSIPTLYCDFSEPDNPLYVPSYTVEDKLYPVRQKRNENAADEKSVVNFVDWCVNEVEVKHANGKVTKGRRAKKYALIFSGHSLGFQDIGLFRDETSGRAMDMDDFYYAIQRIAANEEVLEHGVKGLGLRGEERDRETKVLVGKRLDILGFDSCVMGMLEVGYQFELVADTMIASEGSVPSAGWTYAKILSRLAKGDSGSPRKVAECFVRDFIKSQDAYTVGGVSVDMAAWDLAKVKDLAGEVDLLSETLITCFDDPSSRLYRQMERVILQVHWKCQSYMFDQNVDLGDFCELLDRECENLIEELGDDAEEFQVLDRLQLDCKAVLKALKKAVILSGFSGGTYQYSNGMSIFFPWSREGYEVSRKNYQSLWFAREAGTRKFYWNGFLKKYLNEVAIRKFDEPAESVPAGSKYKYYSGPPFYRLPDSSNGSSEYSTKLAGVEGTKLAGVEGTKLAGVEGTKLAGVEGTKLAGVEGTKLAGVEGTKLAGVEGTKLAGVEGTKLAGVEGTKLAGVEGTKLAGVEGTKLAGVEGTKLAGVEGTKLAGVEGTKLAGVEGTKLAGVEGTKLAGVEGTKLAGVEGTKLAGVEGTKMAGGSSNAFFDNLRLFKNIESRWNISGFTKKSDEQDPTDQA